MYLYIISLLFGCLLTTTKPILDFEISYGNQCDSPNKLIFKNKSKELKEFEWTIRLGGETVATFNTANPAPYVFTKAGNYSIALKGKVDSWENTIYKDVWVKEILLPLPTTISPNGDGKDDTFVISRTGHKLEIYNRWGEVIYNSKDYKNDWGKKVPNGTYLYILTSPTGEKCQGSITVIQ